MCKRSSAVRVRSQINPVNVFRRTIRFNIILPFTNDTPDRLRLFSLPTTVLYTYLASRSSIDFFSPKNKQWAHLNSSITPGGDEMSVS